MSGRPPALSDLAAAAEFFARALDHPAVAAPAAADQDAAAPWLGDLALFPLVRDPRDYTNAFDVGRPEAPVVLLESGYDGDAAAVTRRLVAFYDAYSVAHEPAHPPDHACVELAFLAYLLRLAAAYPERADVAAVAAAFAVHHPGRWLAQAADRAAAKSIAAPYPQLLTAAARFVAAVAAVAEPLPRRPVPAVAVEPGAA